MAKMNVLLADDQAVNRTVISWMLKQLGCDAMPVADGDSAVHEAARRDFDLILIDLEMPETDVAGVIRQVRGDEEARGRRRVPILGVTGDLADPLGLLAQQSGMDEQVLRPLSRQALLAALEAWGPTSLLAPCPKPPLDIDLLTERCRGDAPFVREILASFAMTSPPLLDSMAQALALGDLDELANLAHSLRGGALTVAARPIADACLLLENQARVRQVEPAREALGRVAAEWGHLVPALGQFGGDAP